MLFIKLYIIIFFNLTYFRYIGAAVLNISKTVMYDFAYYYMDRYPGSELCFTDTDSLCFHTPYEKNIYEGLVLVTTFISEIIFNFQT